MTDPVATKCQAASIPTRTSAVPEEGRLRYVSRYSSTLLRVPVQDFCADQPKHPHQKDRPTSQFYLQIEFGLSTGSTRLTMVKLVVPNCLTRFSRRVYLRLYAPRAASILFSENMHSLSLADWMHWSTALLSLQSRLFPGELPITARLLPIVYLCSTVPLIGFTYGFSSTRCIHPVAVKV